MSTQPPAILDRQDPIFDRLEDQIAWYDKKSTQNQHKFKGIKVTEIVAAALIPMLTTLKISGVQHSNSINIGLGVLVTALGVLITILEGLLHLNQYQQNWITYRSTCEALKHEKYVFLGNAPPYASGTETERRALLAERVESLVSQEHAKWASVQQQQDDKNKSGPQPPAGSKQ
ncbi:MAG: DUF4231 domain-containing protein [Candidatus Korobacteraceae bacterium]